MQRHSDQGHIAEVTWFFAARPQFLAVLIVVFVVLTTVVARVAAAFGVALFTAALLAVVAMLRTTTLVPDGVGHHIQRLDWRNRIVAGNY
jgi:hypothetical protein